MAKERVQVQGLGDVAPGIQPTIQRAGQYGIQVQRAGRNKLMDLADALSQVNPTLQQYIGVADVEFEQFQEEMARKSPEEVQAMLKKTEGELDKQVRRGTMGWLTSPLNQKRKMQAVGALLHDDYERQLKAQVEDPANADADINELIAGVKDNLRSQYGSLQSAFVNEGFEGAIRETTRRYTLAHDSLSEAVSREQLELAGKNIAYRASLDNEEGKMADPDAISRWWSENEGAFTPAQLLKLRRDVAMAHARANDRESFEHWMEFSGKLKVGTTTIKDKRIKEDDVFSDYSSDEAVLRADAENMFRQQQNKELQDGNNILRELTNEGVEISAKLANNQSYTSEDGTVINNEEEAFQYLRQKAVDTRNSFVAGPDAVDRIYQSLDAIRKPKPKEEVFLQFKRIFTEVSASAGQNFEETAQDTATMLLSESDNLLVDSTDPTGAARLNPRYQSIAGNILRDIMGERIKTMRQLSSGKYKTVEGESVESTKYQTIVADHMLEYDQDFLSKFETRLKDAISEDKKQEATKAVVTAKPEQYVEGTSKSFIDPSKVVSKEAAMFDTNVFNVEMQLREGNLEKAFKEASNLEDASIPYFEREKPNQYTTGYEIPTIRFKSKIDQLVETIESTSKLKEEKETARKGLSVYMLAKNLFNAENIKQGFVTVKTFKGDRDIPVDKEAVKKLLPLYPLLSRERLLALQADPNADKTPEKEMYEAIFEETLDDNSKEDQDKVDLFITQQMEAAARF